jgi:hypothetical protein
VEEVPVGGVGFLERDLSLQQAVPDDGDHAHPTLADALAALVARTL